jgi:hypothetical protein
LDVLRHQEIPETIVLVRGVPLNQYLIMKVVPYVASASLSVLRRVLTLWMSSMYQIMHSVKGVVCVPMSVQRLQLP